MIIGNKVFLRNFRESDIPNMIRWFTIETEWMNWDAPWENEINSFNPEEYRKSALKRLNETDCVDRLKHRLQICINDENEKHIGWVSSYYIDEDYNFTDDEINITIGIAIPDLDSRNKGYATEAWILYINYLIENGNEDVYTE
ncbi:MAG: GNAT family N-acetyltransferase, partial [Tissierellia bacterium]|nr:GNAT family N-acetyltransferase [Tissierellia bacterium]